jgi:hypothetical protein
VLRSAEKRTLPKDASFGNVYLTKGPGAHELFFGEDCVLLSAQTPFGFTYGGFGVGWCARSELDNRPLIW